MTVKVIRVFYDSNGLHKVGEKAEVDFFDEKLMEKVNDVPKLPKKPKKEAE